jgi:hypothetical protein
LNNFVGIYGGFWGGEGNGRELRGEIRRVDRWVCDEWFVVGKVEEV